MNAKLTRVIIKQETQVIRFKQMFLSTVSLLRSKSLFLQGRQRSSFL